MHQETLNALHGSIEKWEMIVSGEGEDHGSENCPLCQLFYDDESELGNDCDGCPVSKATGKRYCHNTPYAAWYYDQNHRKNAYRGWKADTELSKRIAQQELDFLKSLLPKD